MYTSLNFVGCPEKKTKNKKPTEYSVIQIFEYICYSQTCSLSSDRYPIAVLFTASQTLKKKEDQNNIFFKLSRNSKLLKNAFYLLVL